MSPEKQRIAIAEYCGWKRSPAHDFNTCYETVEIWAKGNRLSRFENTPDYLNDLNAANEAETHLKPLDWARYFDWIQDHGAATGVRATAAERVEGILRTIGKWEE